MNTHSLGIILKYSQRDGTTGKKEIDLLHLSKDTDVEVLANQIIKEQPLLSKKRNFCEYQITNFRRRYTPQDLVGSNKKSERTSYEESSLYGRYDFRIIEHFTKKNSKTVLDFLTALALQEYQELDTETTSQNIAKTLGNCKMSQDLLLSYEYYCF